MYSFAVETFLLYILFATHNTLSVAHSTAEFRLRIVRRVIQHQLIWRFKISLLKFQGSDTVVISLPIVALKLKLLPARAEVLCPD